jgi:hypothetical protein
VLVAATTEKVQRKWQKHTLGGASAVHGVIEERPKLTPLPGTRNARMNQKYGWP